MDYLISVVLIIVAIVWAVRIETGLNKLNETMLRIEKKLESKEEKK